MTSTWFELLFAALIMGNACTMAVDVQYHGIQAGYKLKYRSSTRSAADAWPHCEQVLDIFDWFFGLIFSVEVALKMLAYLGKFFTSGWNLLDLAIVILFAAETLFTGALPVGPEVLRQFHLFRLARLLKLIRQSKDVDSLYLLTTALQGSISVLVWVFLLLFVVQMVLALILGQILQVTYLKIDSMSETTDEQRQVFEYFGTFG